MLGIETRLLTIPDLNVTAESPDQITVPQAWVGVPPIPQYHATMANGRLRLSPTITIAVSRNLTRGGQLQLARFADPAGTYSVKAAIEADKTLGGVVQDCIVVDFDPRPADVGAFGFYGGVWNLQVVALGS
jgi:hypothetical protein